MGRRKRGLEFAFGLDSFLDVIANVIGILVRLLIVVWFSARTYTFFVPPQPTPAAAAREEVPDPLEKELAGRRRELAEAEARLAERARKAEQARQQQDALQEALVRLDGQRQGLAKERSELDRVLAERRQEGQAVTASAEEVRQRCDRILKDLRDLEKQPTGRKTLRYRTPVSKPVQADEVMFECQGGRVAFVDVAALLDEVKRDFEVRGDQLRTRWTVSALVGPVGAFRLRYVAERQRDLLDGIFEGPSPDPNGGYRAGLSAWEVVPSDPDRGETEEKALAAGSEFRRLADAIDPKTMTVTFWVYPDSFALYRQLRDYLYDREVVVAGRPLPDGYPIASSRQGSASRGQ